MALILGGLAIALMRADLAAVGNLNLPGPVFVPPAELPPVVATPRRRALVVLVDGLRADVAMRLPFVSRLAATGAQAELVGDMPTYSAAQWVAALTGVRPADSGVRGNMGLDRTPLDSVPRRLTASGRVAAQVGDDLDWWLRLFGDDWRSVDNRHDGKVVLRARAAMADADLLLVHLTEVDSAGHAGGVDASYLAAARRADAQLRELALAWGWPRATVIAFSDHGHRAPRGGHGGDEPEVRRAFFAASGPGVRAGTRLAARMVDVAPTLAALLGAPSPAQAQGRTLVEILDAPPAARLILAGADALRQASVAAAVAAGRQGLARVERDRQLLRGAAVALCALLCAVFVRRARPAARLGLLVGAASLALTAALYLLVFQRVSFSADRDATDLVESTIRFGFAACAVTFAVPFAALATRRLRTSETSAMAFLIVAGASPAAVLVFVLCGAFTARLTCEPAWLAVGPLLAYGALIPVALLASVLCGVSGLLAYARSVRSSSPMRASTSLASLTGSSASGSATSSASRRAAATS